MSIKIEDINHDISNLSKTKAKRRKTIVDKAYKMFLDVGISSTSMNDIAEACGITRRTIYNYFNSKTDLLNYLMSTITQEIDPDFHLVFDGNISASDNMRNLLRRNFESYYKHMTDFLFITQVRFYLSYHADVPLSDVESDDLHRSFIKEIQDLVELGQKNGEFQVFDTNSKEIAVLIYRTLYGYLSNITVGVKVDKDRYDKECKVFEDMILEYLRK